MKYSVSGEEFKVYAAKVMCNKKETCQFSPYYCRRPALFMRVVYAGILWYFGVMTWLRVLSSPA